MDKEMEQFQKDLLNSVRQMKSGKGTRKTQVALFTHCRSAQPIGDVLKPNWQV